MVVRRTTRNWVARCALATCAIALAYGAVIQSVGSVLRKSAPIVAYNIAPWDGRNTAAAATNTLMTGGESAEVTRLGRLALRQDAMAASAVGALIAAAQADNRTAEARRLFAYSQLLSRRDTQSRLWAIEDAVGRGDIAEALHHYDIALRTSLQVSDLLYPTLTGALNNPAVAHELVRTLARHPGWELSFIEYASLNATDMPALARFFRGLSQAGVAIPPGTQTRVVGKLLQKGQDDMAWTYYTTIRPGSARNASRDPDFSARLSEPSPFDWTPVDEGVGISGSFHDGLFDFSAPSAVGGRVLQQLQMLPTGRYRIRGRSAGLDQSDTARPYWVLACRDGQELGRVEMPASAPSGPDIAFQSEFTVPQNCPVQTLRLMVRATNRIEGLTGQVKAVQLTPVP